MVDIRILEDWDYPAVVAAQTPAQRRAAEAARIKVENEARKQRVKGTDTTAPTTASVSGAITPTEMRTFGVTPEVANAPAIVQPTTTPAQGVQEATPDMIRAISGASNAEAAQIIQDTTGGKIVEPTPIVEDTQPAKPAGVAGADWVWENNNWVLKSTTETPFVATPGGGLTPQGEVVEGGAGEGEGEDTPPTQFVEYEYTKDFTKRRAKFFDSKTGKFTFGEWEDSPVTKEDFDAEQARIAEEEAKLNEKRDAFALVEATMRSYGFNEEELKEITDYIAGGLVNPKLGPNQLLLQLRQLQSYKDRFAGNEARRAKGLNALSEAAYLQQERDYAQTLGLYGQNKFVSRQQFADLIGNDISNTELSQRVATAVNRLQNADPSVLKQLREYYPSISEQDIVSYFLSPDQTLPELEVKTTTAEIGATARQYGLDYGMGRATELQQYGVDLERARTGFGNIARVLPRTQDLAAFYQEAGIDYNQQIAEEEEFKGLASARRARERLKEIETATFSGQAGTTRGALGRSSGGTF